MTVETAIPGIYPGNAHTGLPPLRRAGFGAMQLRKCMDNPQHAVALLRRAIELGVNHIDTAEFYGEGFVNRMIAQVLPEAPQLVIATKLGAEPAPGQPIPLRAAQRPEELRAGVEANLRTLRLEQLPVVYLRRLDVGPGLTAEGNQIVDMDDQLAVLTALRDQGKIGAIGLSAIDVDGLRRALPAGIACVQNAYSLLSRQYEPLLDLCVAEQIAWVPFFPLGGGPSFTQWPQVTAHPRVQEIAAGLGITPSQLGLAGLLAHRPNILLVAGTTSLAHLEENTAAAAIQLSPETRAELETLAGDHA